MSQPTCADSRPVNPPPLSTEILNPLAPLVAAFDKDFCCGRLFYRSVFGVATAHGCAAFSQLISGTYHYFRQVDTFTVRTYFCNGTQIHQGRWNSVRQVQGGDRTYPPGSCSSAVITYPASAPSPPSCAGSLTYFDVDEYEYSDELTKDEVETAARTAAEDNTTDSGWSSTPLRGITSRAIGSTTAATGDWSPAGLSGSARRTPSPGPLDRRVEFTKVYYRLAGRASPIQIGFDLVRKVGGVETAREAQTVLLHPENGWENDFTWEAGTDEVVTTENLCISPLA